MDRNTVLWTVVVFFGASGAFATVRNATEDAGTTVSLLAQLAAGAAIVAGIVLYMRRRG